LEKHYKIKKPTAFKVIYTAFNAKLFKSQMFAKHFIFKLIACNIDLKNLKILKATRIKYIKKKINCYANKKPFKKIYCFKMS